MSEIIARDVNGLPLRAGDAVVWIHDAKRKPRIVLGRASNGRTDYPVEGPERGYVRVRGVSGESHEQHHFGINLLSLVDPDLAVDEGL